MVWCCFLLFDRDMGWGEWGVGERREISRLYGGNVGGKFPCICDRKTTEVANKKWGNV